MRLFLTIPDFSLHGGIRVILEWANRLSEWHEVKLYPVQFQTQLPRWFDLDPRVEVVGKAELGRCDLLVVTSPHAIHLLDDAYCPRKVVLFLQMLEHLFRPANAGWQRLCRRMYASRHPLIAISQWNIERLAREFGRTGPTYYVGNGVNLYDFPLGSVRDKDFETVLVEGWESGNPTKDVDAVAPRVASALKRAGYHVLAYSAHEATRWADVPDEYYVRPSLARLNDLYGRATVLLKASKFDARSCAPMEAMTKGTPTVRAIIEGDDDLLHGYNSIRTRYAYEEMLAATVSLLKSPQVYFELTENCFKHLAANDWAVWMPIINDILCNA